jgi:predicted GNAT superfamily acetyltransferase
MIDIRDLHTLDEFRQVMALERAIWDFTDPVDLVTPPVFTFTLKCGGILLGAFDGDRMVGFAYSVVGSRHGQWMQWSHMAGVLPQYRGGLGHRLKLEQRRRCLAAGFSLMEWTFDPLQTMNAHFNIVKLGVVCGEYAVNVYGESTSALHRGTPTDRLVAQWRLTEPHVVRRIETPANLRVRTDEVAAAPVVNPSTTAGAWRGCGAVDLALTDRRVWVEIPADFTGMQREAPDLALAWRLHTREIFQHYFARGYGVVDFALDAPSGGGRYLLARS